MSISIHNPARIDLQSAEGREEAWKLCEPLAKLIGGYEREAEFSFPKCKFNLVCREVSLETLTRAAALCRVPVQNVSVIACGEDELLVEIYLVPSQAWRV